jgi:hypothetical protein
MELTDQSVAPASQPQNLTNWKNPPKLSQLKQDLMEAQQVHNSLKANVQRWRDNMHIEGSAKIPAPKKGEPARSTVQPKLIRQQAEWRYPALEDPFLSTPELFKVNPVSANDRKAARQNQVVLNNQFNTKINKVKLINDMVRAAVDEGTVVLRTGWCFAEESYEEEIDEAVYYQDSSFGPTVQYLDHLKSEFPGTYLVDVPPEMKEAHRLSQERGVPVRPELTGNKVWVTKKRTLKNHPTVEVENLLNAVFDPTCNGDLEKANFGVVSFPSSLDQLRKEGKYHNLDQINPSNHTPLNTPDHAIENGAANFRFSDKPRQKLVVYEYWGNWDIDGNGTTKPIVVAWVGDTIIRMEENPYPDKKLPYVLIPYLPKRESLYGEPDGELLEDNQKIIGAITRGMIDLMAKSANGQTGMRRDMLDETNRRKFEQGKDYTYNGNVDPRVGVYQHVYPEIPQSAYAMLALQNQQAESLTGVRSFSEGVSGNSLGDVAAGVRGALDSSSKRENGILHRLKEGMKQVGRKWIAMNAEFLDEEEVIRITDEEFVTVKRDDLAGNFDLALAISTAEEDNQKAQELAFMLQTLGPNDDPAVRRMIQADIARLRKMPDLAQKLENYKPEPDPMQQKLQELEMAKLEMEIAKLRAEAQKIMTDAGLNQVKAVTEQAKAKQLNAAADKTNLDFIEQESGVTQERQKELHGEQARAQTQQALIEHGLNMKLEREKMGTDLLKEYLKQRNKPKPK